MKNLLLIFPILLNQHIVFSSFGNVSSIFYSFCYVNQNIIKFNFSRRKLAVKVSKSTGNVYEKFSQVIKKLGNKSFDTPLLLNTGFLQSQMLEIFLSYYVFLSLILVFPFLTKNTEELSFANKSPRTFSKSKFWE